MRIFRWLFLASCLGCLAVVAWNGRPELWGTLADLLHYLWPVTTLTGILYLAGWGDRRDPILDVALSAGVGLTACMGLWFVRIGFDQWRFGWRFGRWRQPAPYLVLLGLIATILVALLVFRRLRARSTPPTT